MSVMLDIELTQKLVAQPDSLNQLAKSPGFCLYWSHLGYGPDEAIAELGKSQRFNKLVEWGERESRGKTPLVALTRLSGNSIKQEVTRHLPGGVMPAISVEFIPGNGVPLVAEGNTIAVNLYSLQLVANKLQVQGIPLLSLLANRIHRLATEKLSLQPGGTRNSYIDFIAEMLREGCATLFFTVPIAGSVHDQWRRAEERREAEFDLLRRCIHAADKDFFVAEMRRSLALTGDAALAARYPLATWMCRVVEGAFNRSFLVELLLRAHYFPKAFEEARIKFGLPKKYSIAV